MHQTVDEEEHAKEDYSLPCCANRKTEENNVIANTRLSEAENDKPEEITSVL